MVTYIPAIYRNNKGHWSLEQTLTFKKKLNEKNWNWKRAEQSHSLHVTLKTSNVCTAEDSANKESQTCSNLPCQHKSSSRLRKMAWVPMFCNAGNLFSTIANIGEATRE